MTAAQGDCDCCDVDPDEDELTTGEKGEAAMARYRLKIPDYDDDVGEFIEITVEAEDEAEARQKASEQMPGVAAWDLADCVRMRI